MRVLRIIARLNIGGPAIQAVTLTRAFRQAGHPSLLVCGDVESHEGDMAYLARNQGVQPHKVEGLGREISLVNDFRVLVRLLGMVRRFRPSIIHTHTAKAGTLGRLAGMLWNAFHAGGGKVLLIHTFHGHVFHSYFGRWKTRLFLSIERFLARFTHCIVVISPAQKRDICGRYGIAPPGKVAIVPLGFDLGPFARVEENPHAPGVPGRDSSPKARPLRVGIVGRLAPVKNHRLLLKAAARLHHEGPPGGFRFCVVGDGELRDSLERETRELGLSHAVTYWGWRQEMAPVYADLDAVVLTSNNEGTPVSLIEAMAAARPIVATAVGGVPDLLGREVEVLGKGVSRAERGLLVPPEDERALVHALQYLRDREEEAAAMGERARTHAVTAFGLERLVKDLEGLYRELMSKTGGSPGPGIPHEKGKAA